jgi:hypothetical protein
MSKNKQIFAKIKIRLGEWGSTIPGEGYMQISVPINGRITTEAQADFIAQYGSKYEFIRIFKMTEHTFGIHFKKRVANEKYLEA